MTANNNNQFSEFDNHVIYTYIDQWENHSIAKIRLAAQQTRDDLKRVFSKSRDEFFKLLNQINQQLDSNPNSHSNLYKWTNQLTKLRQDLSDLSSSIHLEQETSITPIYLIKLFHTNIDQIKSIDQNKNEESINVPGTEPLTLSILNILPLNEQKQMLGERLFVLVQQMESNFTAKITGMFLEFDIKYILILINSHKILKEKIKEARDILQAHRYKQRHVIQS